MQTTLPSRFQTILLLLAVAAAYLWLRIPTLSQYSLQAVALTTCIYVVLNFAERKKSKLWHFLPKAESALLALITFTLLLLIGATGNLDSPLYPLTYIHLFFLVMSSSPRTAFITTIAVMWFHLALAPVITATVIAHVIVLPIVLAFFEFAKQQHELAVKEKHQLDRQDQELAAVSQEEQIVTTQLNQETTQLQQATSRATSDEQDIQLLQTQVRSQQYQLQQIRNLLVTISQELRTWQTHYFACEPQEKKDIECLLKQIDQVVPVRHPELPPHHPELATPPWRGDSGYSSSRFQPFNSGTNLDDNK